MILLTDGLATVRLTGPPGVAESVATFLWPFMPRCAAEAHLHFELHAEVDSTVAVGRKDLPLASQVRAQVDVRTSEITVSCPDRQWLPLHVARHIRTLARSLCIASGAVPLHGAGVALRRSGVVLVGEKGAGKTTAALSLARSGRGELVSNDDVMLADCGHPFFLRMLGSPRAIGVRLNSVGTHRPPLTSAQLLRANRLHPGTSEGKVFILPRELQHLGGATRVTGHSKFVVELVAGPDLPMQAIGVEGASKAELLARHTEAVADRRRPNFFAHLQGSFDPNPQWLSSLVAIRYSHPHTGWVDDFLRFIDDLDSAVPEMDYPHLPGSSPGRRDDLPCSEFSTCPADT